MSGQTTTLLITPSEVIKRSIIDSNVDSDQIVPCIYSTQINKIKSLLTPSLYSKILNDFENDTLSGDYLLIYDMFIKDMHSYYSAGEFITTGGYTINNGGISRMVPEFGEVADIVEISRLSQHYNNLGDAIALMFKDWVKDNPLPEYPESCGNKDLFGNLWVYPNKW